MSSAVCAVVGQKYGSGAYTTDAAAYAGFNYSDFYPFALKFTVPEFNGKSSEITFQLMISNGKREGARSSKVSLRYAICDSDANFGAYDETTAAVTDGHQLCTGRISFSGLTASDTVQTMTVPVDTLTGGKTYYLILWGDDTGGYYQDYCTPAAASNHAITLTCLDSYLLTISQGTGSTVTVKRDGTALENGAEINHGDVLVITFAASAGYALQTHTVNGSVFTSGGSHTVTAAVSVAATASVLAYVLTIAAGKGASISVTRTSSPKKGAAAGVLGSGSAVYYSDVLEISFAAKRGYRLTTHAVNGSTIASGTAHAVTGNVNVTALASILACLIGGDGKRYAAHIKSGGVVRIYTAYIKRDGEWVPYGQ